MQMARLKSEGLWDIFDSIVIYRIQIDDRDHDLTAIVGFLS
jgi:hypothetical protein